VERVPNNLHGKLTSSNVAYDLKELSIFDLIFKILAVGDTRLTRESTGPEGAEPLGVPVVVPNSIVIVLPL
jgi:hypothetical protein